MNENRSNYPEKEFADKLGISTDNLKKKINEDTINLRTLNVMENII